MATWELGNGLMDYAPSPACILSFLTTGVIRGELGDAWKWTDGPNEVQTDGEHMDEKSSRVEAVSPRDGEALDGVAKAEGN